MAVLTLAAATTSTMAAAGPPEGGVTRIADLPDNYAKFDPLVDSSVHAGEPSAQTLLLADAGAHVLFEVSVGSDPGASYPQAHDCTVYTPPGAYQGLAYARSEWVEYDSRTYARKAAVCGLPALEAEATLNATTNFGLTGVVDSADHVVFAPCICGNSLDPRLRSIIAVKEEPLGIAGDFCVQDMPGDQCTLPRPAASNTSGAADAANLPYHYVQAMSWYAPSDDLLVVTDNMASHSSPSINQNQGLGQDAPDVPSGVAVTDYHVARTDAVLTLELKWTVHLPPNICHRSLTTPLGMTAAAYLSENPADPALFVPCTTQLIQAGGGATTTPTTTVVKVPLQAGGRPTGDPLVDPAVKIEAPIAPVNSEDFLFDPQSERGYLLPSAASTSGMTLAVYDGGGAGRPSGFISRVRVGTDTYNAYGFDSTTGRLYVDDALHDGLFLVDGRLKQGQGYAAYPFPQFATGRSVATWNIATLPPDDAHPYTRVFVPNVTNIDFATQGVRTAQEHMAYITVLADRVPVSGDAPPAAVDSKTYTGTIPQGADLTVTYSGHAFGYGLHSVNVGGYWGAVRNYNFTGPSPTVPFGDDTSDFAAGAVQAAQLADGLAQAQATALSDVNGNGSRAYRACSDVPFAPQGCEPPLSCAVSATTDPCQSLEGAVSTQSCPAGGPTAGTCGQLQSTTTAQEWPYGTAECSDPGPSTLRGKHEIDGSTYTPAHAVSATPAPQPTPVDSGAVAVADCSSGAVAATGRFGCSKAQAPDASSSPPSVSSRCESTTNPLVVGSSDLGPQIAVASAWTRTSVTPPHDGLVRSSVTAVAQDVRVDLGSGASLDVAQIEQVVWAEAGGAPGTAHTSRRVFLQGVTLVQPGEPDTHICTEQPCSGDQTILDKVNALAPSQLYATLPTPDEPFGTEVDGTSPAGSPGGYQAQVSASQAEQQGDLQFNNMYGWGGTEQEVLPALRLVLSNPGGSTLSREVLDFAGVEADASLGRQVDVFSPDTTPPTAVQTQVMVEAGVPSTVAGGTVMLPGQPQPAPAYPSGLLGVLERALAGLGWLVRSPLGGLQMAAFLVLLGLPVALIRRRWTWQSGE